MPANSANGQNKVGFSGGKLVLWKGGAGGGPVKKIQLPNTQP